MALLMSHPFKHPKTGVFWLRKRVPADLRQIVGKSEELRSLNTKDASEAKRRFVQALAEVENRWENLRRGPSSLTEREAHELAIEVHDDWLREWYDNPSEQPWDTSLYAGLWAPLPNLDAPEDLHRYFLTNAFPPRHSVEQRCQQHATTLLNAKGLTVDEIGRLRYAKAIAAAMQRASLTLAALAQGQGFDQRKQAAVDHAAPFARSANLAPTGPVPFKELLDGWAAEKRPAEKTVYEWRRVAQRLAEFLEHDDAARLSEDDLLRWKASMVEAGLRAKTIRDAQLAPIRAILRWGVDNRRLVRNPGEKVSIDVKVKPGEGRRGFNDEEAAIVLEAALTSADPVLRWVPWLCAYTGARVSEICQLRRKDVVELEGIWCVRIDPEAGSLKNAGSERSIPLHSALVDRGFLQFVETIASGPIFDGLAPDKFGKRGGNGTKVLGRWVRSLGLDDPRLAPNHSWRHRLKTLGRRYGLALDIVDAITGHARKTVGDSYGEYPISALLRELSKIPDVLSQLGAATKR